MRTVVRILAIISFVCSPTFCWAENLVWCAPDVVTLTFNEHQNGNVKDVIKIEVMSNNPTCIRNPETKGFGFRFDRTMRIE